LQERYGFARFSIIDIGAGKKFVGNVEIAGFLFGGWRRVDQGFQVVWSWSGEGVSDRPEVADDIKSFGCGHTHDAAPETSQGFDGFKRAGGDAGVKLGLIASHGVEFVL